MGFHATVNNPSAYARRAFETECDLVSSSGHGRNGQLNKSAFAVGQLVGTGLIERSEAEHGLFSAAQACGYVAKDGPAAARVTIASGIEKGISQPREGLNTQREASTVTPPPKPAPKLEGVPVPDWREPGADGKPKFFAISKAEPPTFDDDLRRHVYWRDGQAVRVKVKKEGGEPQWVNFYRVRRPSDGAIGWQAKAPEGFVPVPYIGPPGASDPFADASASLVWAEGEKDVDALRSRGFAAFTFGSAGDIPDCADLLRGRDVIVTGDNDGPGEKGIRKKVATAFPVASRVRTVRFPDLTSGGDVSDFFEAGASADDFMGRAKIVEPETVAAEDSAPAAPAIIWYGDAEPEPPAYLIEGVLPQEQIAILAGQSSAGKTFIGADIAVSVMTGRPFIDHKVCRRGAVLWLAAEGQNEIGVRIKAACIHQTGQDSPGKLPFAYQAFSVPTLTEADALDKLKALVEATKSGLDERFPDTELVLIVIDTLNSAAGFQDENSSSETQKVMNTLRHLSDDSGALVLVIDHYGKMTETGVRGSSAKIGAADAILAALADKNTEGDISNRRMAIVKLRSAPAGRVVPFKLTSVNLDTWGNTHCGVEWKVPEPGAVPETPKADKPAWTGNARVLKSAIERALIDHGAMHQPFGSEGPILKTVQREKVRVEFYASYSADSPDAKKKAFRRLVEQSAAKGLIASRELAGTDWFWLVKTEDQPQ